MGSQRTRNVLYDEIAAGTTLTDIAAEADIDADEC